MNKDKMELEEAINNLKKLIEPKENRIVMELDIQALETVLQALENSIPKKKIEDKIEELNVVENAEALTDILYRQNYTITELVQFVLQELLEE